MKPALAVPDRARPGLRFLAPSPSAWLLALARRLAWLYVKLIGIRRIEVHGGEILARMYRQFQEGKVRFIIAFRHPSTDDPPVVYHLCTGLAARIARGIGERLPRAPGVVFLYDRAMLEWAGPWLAKVFPRIGAISVFPGMSDWRSVSAVRRALAHAPAPVALAPEGQVTFHVERVAPLEPGTAQLAFWCLEDLEREKRSEQVFVLPVSLSYHYRQSAGRKVDELLDRVERECGLARAEGGPAHTPAGMRYERAMRIVRRLVEVAESWYARFYRVKLCTARTARIDANADDPAAVVALQRRIDELNAAALDVADRLFAASHQGDWVQRVMKGRQTGYARRYRGDIEDLSRVSPVEQSLAGRLAAESWLALRHVELVGVLAYVRLDYLRPDSGIDRYVEFVANLWDVANRLKGADISGRIALARRDARIQIDEPIPVGSYLPAYRASRRDGVAQLTAAIHESFRRRAESQARP